MRVRFLIDFDTHRDGDVADLPAAVARVLVEGRVAEPVPDRKAKVPDPLAKAGAGAGCIGSSRSV